MTYIKSVEYQLIGLSSFFAQLHAKNFYFQTEPKANVHGADFKYCHIYVSKKIHVSSSEHIDNHDMHDMTYYIGQLHKCQLLCTPLFSRIVCCNLINKEQSAWWE